jgi:hypothetical protein
MQVLSIEVQVCANFVAFERHHMPGAESSIPLGAVTSTRGNDLSGTLQGAGGIGGLLAPSETILCYQRK